MLRNFTTALKPAVPEDLQALSLKSSQAKSGEVFIFEKTDMSDLFDKNVAEKIRDNFLKNNIKVKQITNQPTLDSFTESDAFVNSVMSFRYVPKDIFDIENEILIFDDTVAVYNKAQLMIIEDKIFTNNYKQLFLSIWDQGQSPTLNFDYKPNHSFYKNIDYFIGDLQIIVWPDAEARNAYAGLSKEELGEYIKSVIQSDNSYKKASFIIVFMWALDNQKMLDVWMFDDNYVDDRSGPLSNAKIYKEGKLCNDVGISSGNTLLVLGYEEKQRRQSKDLKAYLQGPPPNLPLEIVNGKNYFE